MSCRTPPPCAATRIAGRRADRARSFRAALVALPLLAAFACRSQSDEEQLTIHRIESKHYYDVGDYERAADQCRRGLEVESGDAPLRLTLAWSLLMQGERKHLLEAAEIFKGEIGWFGSSDWRLHLGAGMTDQELARLLADSKSKEDLDQVEGLRRSARIHLDRAYEASEKDHNSPPELLYHLALLDLDEQRNDLFQQHAEAGITVMASTAKVLATQVKQETDAGSKTRLERERDVNSERARRLLHELARLAWNREPRDATAASNYMVQIEQFGPLARPDYFNRGRMRETTGDLEGAVADFEKFLSLSAQVADDNVNRAVESLQRVRSQLAERRTSAASGGR